MAPRSLAHELDYQELLLYWDASRSQLRGQILTDPKRLEAAAPEARAASLLARLREELRLELDGERCPLQLSLRELWVPAGATLGDSVMLACARAEGPRRLRVFAGPWLHGLRVTVQQPAAAATTQVLSTQTSVLGGAWSGVYSFEEPSRGFSAPSVEAPARNYLLLGVRHILEGGWDHLAFVAALVLGRSARFTLLLWELTAFTAAHSLSLALGALGVIVLPRAPIELGIALSVCAMALCNLDARSRVTRAAPALVFAFGLLHGQGFAGNLLDAGLPASAFVWALLGFNVGVELGQAAWAGALFLGLSALPAHWPRPRFVQLGSLALGALGLYWTWERGVALLSP